MIKKNSLLVLVPVLLAVLIANLLTPFIYRNVSSDFGRTQLILKALDSQPAPDIVLLGNSILMSGIDAKHMSNSLNNELVYNFGSNGQTLKESFLYYDNHKKKHFLFLNDICHNF